MFAFGCPRPAAVEAAASSEQDWPVNDECHGSDGTHQLSVATLYTSLPMAYASLGNSSTFATVASFGLYPCWRACFHIVAKSGGSGTLVKKSAPEFLNCAIIDE